LQAYPLETSIEEILATFSGEERIQTTEAIACIVAVSILVSLLAPEAVTTFIVLYTPSAQIPLRFVLEGELFAALLTNDIATVDVGRNVARKQCSSGTLTNFVNRVGSYLHQASSVRRGFPGKGKFYRCLGCDEQHIG